MYLVCLIIQIIACVIQLFIYALWHSNAFIFQKKKTSGSIINQETVKMPTIFQYAALFLVLGFDINLLIAYKPEKDDRGVHPVAQSFASIAFMFAFSIKTYYMITNGYLTWLKK